MASSLIVMPSGFPICKFALEGKLVHKQRVALGKLVCTFARVVVVVCGKRGEVPGKLVHIRVQGKGKLVRRQEQVQHIRELQPLLEQGHILELVHKQEQELQPSLEQVRRQEQVRRRESEHKLEQVQRKQEQVRKQEHTLELELHKLLPVGKLACIGELEHIAALVRIEVQEHNEGLERNAVRTDSI